MVGIQTRVDLSTSISGQISTKSTLRKALGSQASRLALRSSIGLAAAVLAPSYAWANCVVGATTVTCDDTVTTDTTFAANPPVDRNYQGLLPTPIVATVSPATTVSGNGLAFTNSGTGGVTVTNNGTISVDAGNTPTAGGTAALSVFAAGGPITYTGGSILNNGNGNAFDAVQTGGVGSVSIGVTGNIFAAAGEGVTVRDVATSTGISVTTGAVTALTAGKDGIDAQSQSLTGNITETANGSIQAGNAGMVAALLNAGATGNIAVTANGPITARFGVDAENFGSGSTGVTTIGAVNATSGNGIFALTTGGDVVVAAGDVTSTGNTAIIAQQTKVVGNGGVYVNAANVSGTTGIDAHNFGTGLINVVTHGTVTGTSAEGIKATGNGAVTVTVDQTVTGATRGLSVVGGTAGTGDIIVTGTGGFVGGTGDAANVLNNGSGATTVNISGASSSAGGEGIFVRDTAAGSNIVVATGAVTALTAGKDAIDVQAQTLTGGITEVAAGNIQAGNAGMVAALLNAGATGNINVFANGSIDARFGVDAENFGSGFTSVTTVGPVNVTTGNGIFALTTGGNLVVNAGDVTSTGNTAIIAQQTKVAGTGLIAVGAGNVSGTTGIDVHNFGTGGIGIGSNGTVTGTFAEGIKAIGNSGVIVLTTGTVTGATRGLSLVGGTGGAGNISVTGTGGFVGGTGDAANILNNGSGAVNVNISGASSSGGGEGFFVRDTAAGGNITVATGAVTALTAGKDAIDVQAQTLTGNIIEVANGNIQAGNAGMVAALLNAAGTGNITVTANGSIDARFGIDAENFGSGSTGVTTVGPVNVTTGNGIFALTTGGNLVVNAGDVTSTGNTAIIAQQTKVAGTGLIAVGAGNVSGTTGIDVHNFGTGGIGIGSNGTVTGTLAEGIKAIGNSGVIVLTTGTVTGATRGLSLVGGTGGAGNISVTGTGGFVGGTGDAANILNNGSGTTTVNISGASSSAGGEGIFVRDTAAGGDISITTGAVTALTAGKDAIDVQAQTLTGNVTEVANGNIQAGNAGMVAAILNAAGTGNINVTANGSVTARFGIDAENFGSGSTSVTTVGPVNVTTGNGIFALATGGNVTVNAGAVTSTGNTAIFAQQTKGAGAGIVGVTAGNVSGTTGIDVNNVGTGATNVTANGTVTGTAGDGIHINAGNAVTVSIANTVSGSVNGLFVNGAGGGAGNISVTGAGGLVAQTGYAALIQNNGTGTVTYNVSGASSSTSGNGIVVRDTAVGSNISVTTGAVSVGVGGNAIDVQTQSSTANVTEVANGNLQAGNAGMVAAIFPAAATGNIDVTANGSITARFGVDAENFGTGTTSVHTVGPVNATSGNGIYALSTLGAVTVNAGDVTSTGNTAIIAQLTALAGTGALNVTAGNVSGTTGIFANNAGSGAVTVTTHGTVTGTAAEGIKATGNAAVTVTADARVTGATNGLTLVGGTGGAGNISVTGTGGFAGGTGDAANILNNGSGTVTVNAPGASSSTGGNGFVVRDTAAGGNISVTTGAVTALTAGKNAIDVQTASATANITEVANGNIQAGNAGMVAAIFPAAATGNIGVTANGSITARFGVDAENFGTGTTSVTTVGPVNVTTGNGIFALTTGGNVLVNAGNVTSTGNTAIIAQQTKAASVGTVNVTTGTVSGTTGIDARNLGFGAINITTHGTVTGTAAEGIKAVGNGAVTVTADQTVTGATLGLSLVGGTSGTGAIIVNNAGGFVGGTGDAANILNNGAGAVNVNIAGASSSTGGNGIVVRDTAVGTGITVATGAVTALTAGKNAIDVQSQSLTGNVVEVANGNVQAGNAGMVAAIFPAAATGNIGVTANGSITARFGVDAENLGTGTVAVTTIGPVNVTTGNGVFALSKGGNVAVTTGSVTSTGATAIIAQNTGAAANSGKIDVTLNAGSTITANAVGANGIQTNSGISSGTTTINVNGTIHSAAAGISSASTTGNIVTNIGVNGAIDPLIGIDQTTVSGAITVNNAGLVQGTNIGVRLGSTGVGAAGALTVNNAATGTINGAIGVDLGGVNAALVVNNAGSLVATTTGVRLTATGTGSGTVTNSGTLTGGTNAVLATLAGGSFTLTNTGTFNGALNVSGSNVATSTVTNALNATANFGSGASSVSGNFVNAGTANIAAGGNVLFAGFTTNSGRINFLGAGFFATNGAMTNTGIINAQNNLTTNVVTVGGNYTGGGQFFADYSEVAAAADRLNITGTASGNTNVTMNRVGGRAFVAGGFLPVVTVTPGAAIGTFTSNTVFPTTGFILDSFGRNPASNTQFGLIQQINPSAISLGNMSYVAESASMLLDEPLSPYVTGRTDQNGAGKKFNLWMRGTGGHTRQTVATSITGGGVSIASTNSVRTEHEAIQGGGDIGMLKIGGGNWNVHLGVTGGWFQGTAQPSATEAVKVDASFAGAYIVVDNGAFTLDGTIRREWRNYELVLPALFGASLQQVHGSATAGSVHAAYRFGFGSGFAATPFVGFNYADSKIDNLTIDADSIYMPGNDKTEVGQAGLRLSYRVGSEDKLVVEPFASVSYLKNWSRGDTGSFSFGTPVTTFALSSTTWDNAMRYSFGVQGHARNSRVSAFVVGNIDDSSQLRSFTVNGGIRFNF